MNVLEFGISFEKTVFGTRSGDFLNRNITQSNPGAPDMPGVRMGCFITLLHGDWSRSSVLARVTGFSITLDDDCF